MKGLTVMKRVRIYLGERDRPESGHEPAWEVILRMLKDERASGATVFRGLAGFGEHNRIHMGRLADVIPDLPMVIEWLDDGSRVDRILPHIAKVVRHRIITVEDVQLYRDVDAHQAAPDEASGTDSPT